MVDIILGYIWHYIVWAWPYFAVIAFFSLINISIFHLGRRVEHRKWRREVKSGKLLGELAQQQLKERDDRIRRLTRDRAQLENLIEQVGVKHRRIVGLSQEIVNAAMSEDTETLRRRKRAG